MRHERLLPGNRQQVAAATAAGSSRKVVALSQRRQDGVTSIEYALLASLIAMAIVVGVGALGTEVKAMYEYIAEKVVEVVGG